FIGSRRSFCFLFSLPTFLFVLEGSGKQRELRRNSLRTAASYTAYIWLSITVFAKMKLIQKQLNRTPKNGHG
ncbi:MAG: hypothetical protein WBK03_07830, partial [Dethiobacteria bacterium]